MCVEYSLILVSEHGTLSFVARPRRVLQISLAAMSLMSEALVARAVRPTAPLTQGVERKLRVRQDQRWCC